MSGVIFVNYRRGDDAGFTQALYMRLEDEFGPQALFMDVEGHIKPGDDFVTVLDQQVAASDVVLAVIGPRWVDLLLQRANDKNDFVAIEIRSALERGKRVIPVLVGGAEMPRVDLLPDFLQPLARRNAVGLRPERFKSDCQGLLGALREALGEAQRLREAATEAERLAAEAARRAREEEDAARLKAVEQAAIERLRAGLSPEEIRKAEELANWQYVEPRGKIDEIRNHLARFAGGTTELYAAAKLGTLAWAQLKSNIAQGGVVDVNHLRAFLAEFPNATEADEARAELRRIEATEAEQRRLAAQRALETREWAAIASSTRAAEIEEFLAAWPDGQHAGAARARLRELAKGRVSRWIWMLQGALLLIGLMLVVAAGYWFAQSRDSLSIVNWSSYMSNQGLMLIAATLPFITLVVGCGIFFSVVRADQPPASVLMTYGIVTTIAVGSLWFVIGYSLTHASGGSLTTYVGGLSKAFLSGVTAESEISTFSNKVTIPERLFVLSQLAYAALVPLFVMAAFGTSRNFKKLLSYLLVWVLLVYCPTAHMVWYWSGPDALADAAAKVSQATGAAKTAAMAALDAVQDDAGMMFKWGLLDFAGGVAVVLLGLIGALAAWRSGPPLEARPVSGGRSIAGLGLIATAWLSLIAGANLESNFVGVSAITNALIAIASAFIFCLLSDFLLKGRIRAEGAILGTMAGISVIAAGSGFTGPVGAIVLGLSAAFVVVCTCRVIPNGLVMQLFFVVMICGCLGLVGAGLVANPHWGGLGVIDYTAKPGEAVIGDYVAGIQFNTQLKSLIVILVLGFIGSYPIRAINTATADAAAGQRIDQGVPVPATPVFAGPAPADQGGEPERMDLPNSAAISKRPADGAAEPIAATHPPSLPLPVRTGRLTAVLGWDGQGFWAKCIEIDAVARGSDIKTAKVNLIQSVQQSLNTSGDRRPAEAQEVYFTYIDVAFPESLRGATAE